MITLGDLFHLLCDCVELGSWPVKGAPSNKVGPVVAFATDPASTELFEETKLVGTLGIRVYRRRIGGVVTRSREPSASVKMSGHAMVISHRGVLAWVPFRVSDTHLA